MMDKIRLHRMQFYGYHGVLPEEKKLGQRFFVELELFLDLQRAGKSDALDESIDYSKVYELVQDIVEGEPKNLIEAVAESIAEKLLQSFHPLEACRVIVIKPDPPINGHYDSVSVEMYREKKR